MKSLKNIIRSSGSLQKGFAVTLVAALLLTLMVPTPVRGQLGLGLAGLVQALQAIYDIIRNEIGEVLAQIATLTQWFNDYYQLVLFPKQAIDAARAFVRQVQSYFQNLINQVLRLPVNSATLVAPHQLESLIRAGSLDFSQLAVAYHNVYGPLPLPGDASPLDRTLIDADDAMAINSLKSLGAHEATVSISLQAAGAIENRVSDPGSAPGAAPFLSAAGILASVQTQAAMQKMMASQLRQEAALLAHRNALLKRDVVLASQMRETINNLVTER
jgi:hypothetical protein